MSIWIVYRTTQRANRIQHSTPLRTYWLPHTAQTVTARTESAFCFHLGSILGEAKGHPQDREEMLADMQQIIEDNHLELR